MREVKRIFSQLFHAEPLIIEVPGWSNLSPEAFIQLPECEQQDCIYLAIAPREDSQFHFYNDAYQSHISAMVSDVRMAGQWFSPMEEVARQMLRENQAIRGFNLYLMAMGQKKKGKTYELLMKTAMAKGLDSLFSLGLDQASLTMLICGTNNGSVLDALFLGQIFQGCRELLGDGQVLN